MADVVEWLTINKDWLGALVSVFVLGGIIIGLPAQVWRLFIKMFAMAKRAWQKLAKWLGSAPKPVPTRPPGNPPPVPARITKAKGSYVLLLGPPLVPAKRLVHFSWGGRAGPQSFKVRDYISGKLLQQPGARPQPEGGFQINECAISRDAVWATAQAHIPASGELYHSVDDFAWWKQKLAEMTKAAEDNKSA